jgi:hypothetical protein
MLISANMLQARQNALRSGIQQTNRYRMYTSFLDQYVYPFEVILPGLGYETLDHSLWSIARKVPFRKNFSDLQVKFIMGNDNYAMFINLYNAQIPDASESTVENIASEDVALKQLLNTGVSINDKGETEPNTGETLLQSFDPILDPADVAIKRILGGSGLSSRFNINYTIPGASPRYIDTIYNQYVGIELLSENQSRNSILYFEEAFITQIQPTQMTSVETGYSTFTVNFKFARMTAL